MNILKTILFFKENVDKHLNAKSIGLFFNAVKIWGQYWPFFEKIGSFAKELSKKSQNFEFIIL